MGYSTLKTYRPMFVRFDTIPACNGLTDRIAVAKTALSIAARCKIMTVVTGECACLWSRVGEKSQES